MNQKKIVALALVFLISGLSRAEEAKVDLSSVKSCQGGKCQPIERGYCRSIENGFCNDTVIVYDLRSDEPNPVVFANCAAGSVMVIQIPKTEKLKGNPVIGNTGLFQTIVQGDPPQVMVWTKVPKGTKPEDIQDVKTNMQINLDSGISILIMLRVSFFDSAVQRIVFRYPEREKQLGEEHRIEDRIRKKVDLEFQQMRTNLDAEAHRLALSRMARGVLKRAFCESLRAREMRDLLVVHATQICQIGDHVFIKFEIHNRARDLFILSSLDVVSMEGDSSQPLDAVVEWGTGDKPQLRFDQKAEGVVMFPVTKETASTEYGIRVKESAGKKREVLLDDIGF